MGSFLEINDTLQITAEQGFPADILDLQKHTVTPITLNDVKDRTFSFSNKTSARIFQLDPVRVYFVQNINGKWLFWGKIVIISQTISQNKGATGEPAWVTSGSYKIIDLYEPEYMRLFTKRESPAGLSYF
jgi:hypothetical protein